MNDAPNAPVLHTIRLRGAWTTVPDGDRVRHTRRFGWPTALDLHERIWLVCPDLPGAAAVALNGIAVGLTAAGALAADVSARLLPRNELEITTHAGAHPGDVRLEVRPADSAGG
ncbi:hypothetical protein J0H58_34025 [bacterium]|nr:hypothetical protein [bacterium]